MLELRFSHFGVSYNGTPAVIDLSLSFLAGTVPAVTGMIGSGKSPLLRAIAGRLRHTGDMTITDGDRPCTLGCISQSVPRTLVSPHMKLSQFLHLGLMQTSWIVPADAAERLDEAVRRCGLEDCVDRPLSGLSPLQLRMAEIAQLLVQRPRIILIDEPVYGRGSNAEESVLTCISKWVKDNRTIAIVASTEQGDCAGFDRIVHLEKGRLTPL